MLKAGQKVKVLYRSTKHAEALIDGKRLVKYALGTLVRGTSPEGEKELVVDYDSTKKAEAVRLGTFIGIKVLD